MDRRAPVNLSGVFPPGRAYGRVYNPRWQGGSPGSAVTRATTLPTPVKAVSVDVTESASGTFPPEIASLLPPGMVLNPDGIPKSQLAVLTGDPDYTRFRQIFLRQMCQRMLNGPRAAEFGFCFSLFAL